MPERPRSSKGQSTNRKAAHNELIKQTMVEIQQQFPQSRMFRSEPTLARQFHSGQVMKFGVLGSPDIYGFIPVCGVAVYTGVEIKTGNSNLTKEQKNMGRIIKEHGGIFVVGREEIYQTIKDLMNSMEKIEDKINRFIV